MKTRLLQLIKHSFIAALLTLLLLVCQRQANLPVLAHSLETTAIVNINVIPMDTERVLRDHVVIVEDGLIAAIGPATEISIPDGT